MVGNSKRRFFFSLAAVISSSTSAQVGFQHLTIPDSGGAPVEIGIWYPTRDQPSEQRFEGGIQSVALDAPVRGDRLPMVLISHGHGGSFTGHSDTARSLAEAGFVAAALTHPGDNWRDISRATAMWERPRQLKLLADYMVGTWLQRARIDPKRIGAFGFSAGGFTVLVAAGGKPDLKQIEAHCGARPHFQDCQIAARFPQAPDVKFDWTHDRRIRAVVSAAPALGFTFDKANLATVTQPVQIWRGAQDDILPHPFYVDPLRLALPRAPDLRVVPEAGHFDFLAPCSKELAKEVPMICTSRPGFDRQKFHEMFNAEVVAFFSKALK
jgi:predicted dienelactone hydrolase